MKKPYIAVRAETINELEDKVNDFIIMGYVPVGGFSSLYGEGITDTGFYFVQAMILLENPVVAEASGTET